ncbi:uncharacterized protein LOC111810568 isoform X1 [Cucurbita pepo subsp. pepo]|uniref:uncharacterized protein LOC111810568 isoform X1 n=1 Tax=Cucurbita pepo subsp. pepo TaxID=3664 RepID=UPI000C9D99CD|nr:uncharacterized protein LOC111810568 isoform X1 [Cucurbita pepo subsp. pepo]
MGKQRYWSGHGRTATASTKTLKNQPNGFDEASSSTSAGCMCAVFQLFDFHPLSHHQHHHPPPSTVSLNPIVSPPPPDDDHLSKDQNLILSNGSVKNLGIEAPRNSVESEEEESSLPCTPKQKEDGLHFPKGIVQIKTKSGITKESEMNSNKNLSAGNDSPSTKTPTLVARLMGLDLLPQSTSPSTTSRTPYSLVGKPKTGKNHLTGTRSLPETPRTSCERKPNVDNYHHRLSLQIPNFDKENASPSPNPSHYAKEIVKQIKETVSRKGGLSDITNNYYSTRRDQDIITQTKPKKVISLSSSSSVSPRLPKNPNKQTPKVEAMKEGVLGQRKPKRQKPVKTKAGLKKSNKQEEPFVVPSRITKAAIDGPLKNTKKTPLSNQLLNFGSVPTIVMKKDPPFPSPIKPSPMQSPCNRNQPANQTVDKESKRYLQSSNHQPHIPIIHHHQHVIQSPLSNSNKDGNNPKQNAADCSYNHDIAAELEYIRQILLRRRSTSSSVYSTVFPENYNTTHNRVSNSHRKLLCHLVEELLEPYLEVRPYRKAASPGEVWADVVEKLCEKVKRLPRAKCEILEDIDGIIEKDMEILGIGFEEEGEGIVKEIEECIVEELLNETVRFVETEMAG